MAMGGFPNKTKKLLDQYFKKNKAVKITGDININESKEDFIAKEKKENVLLKGFTLGFGKVESSLGNIVKETEEIREKTSKSMWDIFTSTSPFGQGIGLLNETLKGVGLDLPKIFKGSVEKVKGFGLKKKEEVERKEIEKPKIKKEKIVEAKIQKSDVPKIKKEKIDVDIKKISGLMEDVVRIQKEEINLTRVEIKNNVKKQKIEKSFNKKKDNKIALTKKKDSKMRVVNERNDKLRQSRLNRDKKKDKKAKDKKDKDEKKQQKKTTKRENTKLKTMLRIGAGMVGIGLLAKDFIGSGGLGQMMGGDVTGGIKTTLFGKAPELYNKTETGERTMKKGAGMDAAKYMLGQTGKYAALGYLVGGEKGAMIGAISGALISGFTLVWKNWIKPFMDKYIVPFLKPLCAFFTGGKIKTKEGGLLQKLGIKTITFKKEEIEELKERLGKGTGKKFYVLTTTSGKERVLEKGEASMLKEYKKIYSKSQPELSLKEIYEKERRSIEVHGVSERKEMIREVGLFKTEMSAFSKRLKKGGEDEEVIIDDLQKTLSEFTKVGEFTSGKVVDRYGDIIGVELEKMIKKFSKINTDQSEQTTEELKKLRKTNEDLFKKLIDKKTNVQNVTRSSSAPEDSMKRQLFE